MKKKLLAIILIIALAVASAIVLTACGDKAPAPDPTIKGNDNNVVTPVDPVDPDDNDDNNPNVIIPPIVTPNIFYMNDSVITGLTEYGKTLNTLTIPASVTAIGEEAFRNRSNIINITFDEGSQLTSIGAEAFRNCSNLMSITIPSSVVDVGADAFYNCNKLSITWDYNSELSIDYFKEFLRNVIISKDVTYVAEGAFRGCVDLNVTWHYNSALSVVNFREALTTVVLADNTFSIPINAFLNCVNLESINIPNSLRQIGEDAFVGCDKLSVTLYYDKTLLYGNNNFGFEWLKHDMGCSKLLERVKTVIISEEITDLVQGFEGFIGLTKVEMPNSIKSIGKRAFWGCVSLVDILIPESVWTIEEFAFSSCTGLTALVIPGTYIEIRSYAFKDCTNLETITFPNGRVVFNYGSFDHCPKLKSIIIGSDKNISSINGIGISGRSANVLYPMPEGAFVSCDKLTSLVIPQGKLSINATAFYNCKIATIYFGGNSEEWLRIITSQQYALDQNYEFYVDKSAASFLAQTTCYYYSEFEPDISGVYWRYVDGVPTIWTV